MLLREQARFDLALRLRGNGGAPLGEVFSFLSGLYFRGKLAYALRFAQPSDVLVITSCAGLRSPDEPVRRRNLLRFAEVPIDADERRYRAPLKRDARRLDDSAGEDAEIVLLGSIATGKYVDTLLSVFGPRLLFPGDFVGRGDMSRGGLLLRSAREGRELTYVPVGGAVRHGPRPPRLPRLPRRAWERA
jgi:hypothetical protein